MIVKEVIYSAKTKQSTMVERVLTEEEISKIELEKVKRLTEKKITELKQKLQEINFDLLQDQAGLIVPNLAEKKQQFISLHNELRTLLNKTIREKK